MMNKDESPLLNVCNITKTFPVHCGWHGFFASRRSPARLTALDNVSFTVKQGRVLGVVGSNGSGKTTLLKVLATLLLPESGEIRFKGRDILRSPLSARRETGWMGGGGTGPGGSFYPRLSARENLRFFASLCGARHDRVEELLDLAQLSSDADRLCKDYSSGMRRRLELARALLIDPPLLLLDEPTRSLDPPSAERIQNFIEKTLVEKEGKTIVLVSHSAEEVRKLAHSCLRLEKGRIAAAGSPNEVLGEWR